MAYCSLPSRAVHLQGRSVKNQSRGPEEIHNQWAMSKSEVLGGREKAAKETELQHSDSYNKALDQSSTVYNSL